MVNVASLVWKNAVANPDQVAVQSDSGQLTFRQLYEASGRVAAAVRSARSAEHARTDPRPAADGVGVGTVARRKTSDR